MCNKLVFVMLLSILTISGCHKDTITITPDNLCVGPEASSAEVKTSGFYECEIIFKFNDLDVPDVMLCGQGYPYEYEGDWFSVTVSDDRRDLYFQFKENVAVEQRSAVFQLSYGDMFNRFTVTQQGRSPILVNN